MFSGCFAGKRCPDRVVVHAVDGHDLGGRPVAAHLSVTTASQNSASPDTELWSVPSKTRSVADQPLRVGERHEFVVGSGYQERGASHMGGVSP